jgi:23S rRNA pseudouridine955/2504/2580 synthase
VIDMALHKYLTPEGERRVRPALPSDGDDDETAAEGKRAISLVSVLRVYQAAELGAPWAQALGADARLSLLQVTIKTGRTHQIRVHLASNGHPIVGDEKYGQFADNKALAKAGLPRMYLHAWRLAVAEFEGSAATELICPAPFALPG